MLDRVLSVTYNRGYRMKKLILVLFLTGCSAFVNDKQSLKIDGKGAVVVNQATVNLPATVKVDRDKSVTINRVENGNIVFTKTISPVPSVWGKLDTWGVYFLFPGIGLFTPGAMQLEMDEIFIDDVVKK